MDWSESLQNAIDYIEEHITEKIDYEEVAKRVFVKFPFSKSVRYNVRFYSWRIYP